MGQYGKVLAGMNYYFDYLAENEIIFYDRYIDASRVSLGRELYCFLLMLEPMDLLPMFFYRNTC